MPYAQVFGVGQVWTERETLQIAAIARAVSGMERYPRVVVWPLNGGGDKVSRLIGMEVSLLDLQAFADPRFEER